MQRILFVALLSSLTAQAAFGQLNGQPINDEISYSHAIKPVVRNFCTTCHAGDNPEGEFVLTSYADVRKHIEEGNLIERLNDVENPMPPSGLLPKYMRRLFQRWADGGFVEQGTGEPQSLRQNYAEFELPTIKPVDINRQGFEFLESMQGHWVGSMDLMGQPFPWMAFDYRAISRSHVHGIFEGGTIGNLFTSFFVTEYNGTRTIVARNGGLLNGIYRTSYFVLDRVNKGRDWKSYRFVDAIGGSDIMWMELTFQRNAIQFHAYTSRFGLTEPRRHMSFQGICKNRQLASTAAQSVGFPKNVVDVDFSNGFPKPNWPDDIPLTSASYVWEEPGKTLTELGKIARDPLRIDQMPRVSKLSVAIDRNNLTADKKLQIYLSHQPLTDASGWFRTPSRGGLQNLWDSVLSFPELSSKESEFTFTYLHPGRYFVTVVADMDEDGSPSTGDVSHPAVEVNVKPSSHARVRISNLNVRN